MSSPKLLTLLALAALVVQAAACNKTAASRSAAPQPITMITLDQINARLQADEGSGKVAVMHMWATWCGPCVEEFPHLARFYRDQLASDGKVDFFAVSVDEPGSKSVVEHFVSSHAAAFPVFIADAPDQEAFSRGINPAWPSVLPTTFIYGLDGRTADIQIGEVDDLGVFKAKIDHAKQAPK